MRLVLLGSGTSSGVPRIGNDWGTCDPAEPRNRRLRVSALIEDGGGGGDDPGIRILIDTGPDMRAQLLAAQVDSLDAVIWTHDHADHCHGIDDLRQIMHLRGRPVRGIASPATLAVLQARFGYVFDGRDDYPPTVRGEILPSDFLVGAVRVRSVDQPHGLIQSAGLRFDRGGKSIVYATDFHEMTQPMRDLYRGVDVLVIDALRRRPHPSHPDLPTVLGWIEDLAPRRSLLIHMDHSMDYTSLCRELPGGVEPGYDGQVVTL